MTENNIKVPEAKTKTERLFNYQEDGKWIGSFKTNDSVKVGKFSNAIGKVTTCFGYGQFGYWYQVHFSENSYGNFYEYELELVEE